MLLFLLFLFAHVCNYFRLLLMRSRMWMRLQLRNRISELSYEHKLVTRRKSCWGHCHMAGVTKCLLILSLAVTSKSHTTALTAAFMFVDTEPKLLMENILACFHNLFKFFVIKLVAGVLAYCCSPAASRKCSRNSVCKICKTVCPKLFADILYLSTPHGQKLMKSVGF